MIFGYGKKKKNDEEWCFFEKWEINENLMSYVK